MRTFMFLLLALAVATLAVGQTGDALGFEREAVAADDECAAAGCALTALQLHAATRAGQAPPDIDASADIDKDLDNVQQAVKGLPGLPSNVASEVGGDLQEAAKDWDDAQKHLKKARAGQAKLEDLYKHVEAEEAEWNEEEAGWDKKEASSTLQTQGAARLGQAPSDIDSDLAQAEQGLGGLPSSVASEVGGDLQEVAKDWADAQKHEKEFHADQAKLEDIYKHTEAEEGEWDKQEAQWDEDSGAASTLQARASEDARQVPSDIGQDFQDAQQDLQGLPSSVSGEVGGDIQEAMKDYQDAQKHEKAFDADQAQLEDIYRQAAVEEKHFKQEEATWTTPSPLEGLAAGTNGDFEDVGGAGDLTGDGDNALSGDGLGDVDGVGDLAGDGASGLSGDGLGDVDGVGDLTGDAASALSPTGFA